MNKEHEVQIPKEKQLANNSEPSKLKKNISSSKTDENDKTALYFGVTLLLSIAVPFVYYSIVINNYGQKHQPEGFNFPHIYDFWRVLAGACVTQIAKLVITKLAAPVFYPIAKGKDDEKVRRKYANKAAENCSQQVQYIVAATWGYVVLRDSKFLPWFMGGRQDGTAAFEATMVNNPFCEFPREVYEWFLYSSGIYFGELVRHVCWDERKNDFGEMLIHHLSTVFLVFGSAYANQIGIGAIISWIHLASDVAVALVKIASSTRYDLLAAVTFVGFLLPSWFYLRLLCLPFWIYNIFTSPMTVYPAHISEFDVFLQLNGLYLVVLQILHVYWYALFLKMLYDFSKTGVAEDTQEKVEAKEKTE